MGFAPNIAFFQLPLLARGFFMLAEAELDFGDIPLVEVDLQGDQGDPFLRDQADQFIQLTAVKQQFSASGRQLFLLAVGLPVGADTAVDQEDLSLVDGGKGADERGIARTQRLDLVAGQYDASLDFFEDFVVVICLFVLCDRFHGELIWASGGPIEASLRHHDSIMRQEAANSSVNQPVKGVVTS